MASSLKNPSFRNCSIFFARLVRINLFCFYWRWDSIFIELCSYNCMFRKELHNYWVMGNMICIFVGRCDMKWLIEVRNKRNHWTMWELLRIMLVPGEVWTGS